MASTKDKIKRSTRPVVVDMTSDQCVWAKAGVVKSFNCINAFDCTTCSFDKTIQDKIAKGTLKSPGGAPAVPWVAPEHWLKIPPNRRKCRHMLTGRVQLKSCARGFDCARCPYDQMMDDMGLSGDFDRPATHLTAGFDMPESYYFHRGHTWARMEYGGRVRVGLDDFALRLVGPVDKFHIPDLGATVAQSEPKLGLDRGQNHAEALSPVDGVVVARNPKVLEAARTANADPYAEGWLMVIQPTQMKGNLKNLLFGEEAEAWMEEESGRLSAMVAQQTGHQLAATGGRVVDDIFGAAPELGWENLVNEFLLT